MTALTTEHFVLQTAANATIAEASARSSLYMLSLSSSLIALGFASQLREVFLPFVSAVMPKTFWTKAVHGLTFPPALPRRFF